MHHLQVQLIAVPNYPIWDNLEQHHLYTNIYQQQHEFKEGFSQYQLFATRMFIKSLINPELIK